MEQERSESWMSDRSYTQNLWIGKIPCAIEADQVSYFLSVQSCEFCLSVPHPTHAHTSPPVAGGTTDTCLILKV